MYLVSSQIIYIFLLFLHVLALTASAYTWIFVMKLNPLQADLAPHVCWLTWEIFSFCFVGHIHSALFGFFSSRAFYCFFMYFPPLVSFLYFLLSVLTLCIVLCFRLEIFLQTLYLFSYYYSSSIHNMSFFFYYFLFSFLLTGDIFLLNMSRLPDRCKFSLHSPILPGSVDSCLLELAVYSQDAVPLLQRFTVEIRYVDTNRNIIISLKVGHEEDAG